MLAARKPKTLHRRAAPQLRRRDDAPIDPDARRAALRFESQARKREMFDRLSISNATKALDHLPEPGCSLHVIMRGNFAFGDIVPAVLQLIAPQTLRYCALTTLAFSRWSATQLIRLIDAKQIATIDLLCSDLFAKADADIATYARESLIARGSRFAAARIHAKIVLFETTDGRKLTSEGSANIRACRSIEQFCLINDPDLFAFHRAWLNDLCETYQPEAPTQQPKRQIHPGRSIKRAGPTAWAVTKDPDERSGIVADKKTDTWQSLPSYAKQLAALITATLPNLPAETVVTQPPQGASAPGPYYAGRLAKLVAKHLNRPAQDILRRTDTKHYHGPHYARQQAPYLATANPACIVVIDDIITSGATLKRCFEALSKSMTFAFAYNAD